MGLIKGLVEQNRAFSNASKCNTWNDIYTSHLVEGKNIVLDFGHIFGTVIILYIGLGASLVIFLLEKLACNLYEKHRSKILRENRSRRVRVRAR